MASKTMLLLRTLQQPGLTSIFSRNINCWTAAIAKKHRRIYVRTYPTILQFPDGSSITIQYPEPVGVIRLPLDLSTLSEEQKKARLQQRIPKTKVKMEEEIEDEFDESRYLKNKKK